MSLSLRNLSLIEPLEARIAPANALPDLLVGPNQTSKTFDLSKLTAAASASAFHTFVKFTTNVDMDPATAGIQKGEIVIELFDKDVPRTVQAFLSYVNNLNPNGDYDGTIIHRSAALDGSGSPEIIQGGGYNFPSFAHIPVGPEIFNEYSDARQNTRGTIALAKTGVGPSTGTSEWFINLTDNSQSLGSSNNGGFTVFGRIVSGLDVAGKIGSLSTRNFGGAFGTLPVQNGFTSGTPTADQVVRIEDAAVIPPTLGTSTDTYTVEVLEVVNGVTGTKTSNILAANITGSELKLNYVKGRSGVAEVKVKVNGVATDDSTFRVDLRPNLFLIDTDTQLFVPGSTAPLKFKVINDGANAISGTARLELQLLRTDIANPPAATTLPSLTVTLNIPAGGSQLLTLNVPIPARLATVGGETYQVVAKLPAFAAERFATDNTSSGGSHELVNSFGLVGGRSNTALKYLEGTNLVTWKLQGAGTATLIPDGTGKFDLKVSNTTATSTVSAVGARPGVRTSVASVEFDQPVGTANLGIVDVTGSVMASNGIRSLTLGNLGAAGSDSLMLIGSLLTEPLARATLKLGAVTNYSIESDMPLASLTATSWTDPSGAKDRLSALSLGSLRIAGDFAANVSLADDATTTAVAISGLLRNSTFQTAGNLGVVTVGGIQGSKIYVGVDETPAALGDFTSSRSILSFSVLGTRTAQTDLFKESVVAARTIGSVKVRGVVEGGTTDLYGFIADTVRSYSRTSGTGAPKTASNLTTAATFDDLGSYTVRVL